MIANYLIYFFQPSAASGITPVITQGTVVLGVLTVIGLIKAIGHIFDAVSDPLVAHWSDRCKSDKGRRIPFMQWSAIPFGLSALMIFCPPMSGIHWINDIWVAVFIWLYFLFYTVYIIPQGALFPELITDPNKRVFVYSVRSLLFVAGSALIYMVPLPVSWLKSAGLSTNTSYQIVFSALTVIGIALLLLSSVAIKEKDYVDSKVPSLKLLPSIAAALKNREFAKYLAGNFMIQTSMAFFQANLLYYVTVLLGLPEAQAPIILVISIVASLIFYPVIVKLSKKVGKKAMLLASLSMFIVAYLMIFFGADWAVAPMAKGLLIALIVAFPFGAINILPASIMSDVIQQDTLRTGQNSEGIFSAAQSFFSKIGQSLAIMVVPSVIAIGAISGEVVGRMGVKMTAIMSAAICIVALAIFVFYREKDVLKYIKDTESANAIAVKKRLPNTVDDVDYHRE